MSETQNSQDTVEHFHGALIQHGSFNDRIYLMKINDADPDELVSSCVLTTSHGRLMIIDVTLGRTISMLKIDNDKISRPFVLNQNLYIIKENSIIRLN